MVFAEDIVNSARTTEVLDEIQRRLSLKYRVDLCKHLGVTQSTLSRQEKAGELPYKEIIHFSMAQGWSLDEIFGNRFGKAADSNLQAQEVVAYTEMVMKLVEKYASSQEIKSRGLGDKKIAELRVDMAKILMEMAISTSGNVSALDIACRSILTINTAT